MYWQFVATFGGLESCILFVTDVIISCGLLCQWKGDLPFLLSPSIYLELLIFPYWSIILAMFPKYLAMFLLIITDSCVYIFNLFWMDILECLSIYDMHSILHHIVISKAFIFFLSFTLSPGFLSICVDWKNFSNRILMALDFLLSAYCWWKIFKKIPERSKKAKLEFVVHWAVNQY